VEEKVPTVFNGSLSRNLLSNNGSVSYSLGVDVMATKFFLLRCCTNCNGSCDNVQCNGLFFFFAQQRRNHTTAVRCTRHDDALMMVNLSDSAGENPVQQQRHVMLGYGHE
jgi:hypothetical protein